MKPYEMDRAFGVFAVLYGDDVKSSGIHHLWAETIEDTQPGSGVHNLTLTESTGWPYMLMVSNANLTEADMDDLAALVDCIYAEQAYP